MRHTFIQLRVFTALVKGYQLTLEDVRAIENEIMQSGERWPVISGTGGVRKMRFGPEKSAGGKSGGLRICYLMLERQRHVVLITMFAKNEASNITAAQKKQIAKLVQEIKKVYETRSVT